jgi:UDP-perosamine 4-acetyltransferase
MMERLRADGSAAAMVALGANSMRLRLGNRLSALGYALPPVLHPAAQCSPGAMVAEGAVIMWLRPR